MKESWPEDIRGALEKASNVLELAGLEDPETDAGYLLSDVLECRRSELYLKADRSLTAEELERFAGFIERRKRREPCQYITGTTEFMGLLLHVTPDVLIPRPETELVVEVALSLIKVHAGKRPVRVIDLCTGSGCIAVSMASLLPSSTVYATDVSARALEVASGNARLHNVAERVVILEGDLFAPLRDRNVGAVDLVISNPPYVTEKDYEDLEPDVRDYEPPGALRAGPEGLDYYRRIVTEAPEFLSPKGLLVMELGFGQAGRVASLIRESGAYEDIVIKRDYSGIERIISARARFG